jgi:integral membrane protein
MSLFQSWRVCALAEGVSYLLLLFIAMPLKYVYGQPLAVRLAGSLHGALFVVFVVLLALVLRARTMTLRQGAVAFVASVLPFGAFVFDRYIVRHVDAEGSPRAERPHSTSSSGR